MAVASLVLGIISLVFLFFGPLAWIGGIVGVIGIILGAIARKKLKAENQATGTATAGMVMSIIGTVLTAIITIACIACIAAGSKEFNKSLEKELNDPKFKEELRKEMEKGLKEGK